MQKEPTGVSQWARRWIVLTLASSCFRPGAALAQPAPAAAVPAASRSAQSAPKRPLPAGVLSLRDAIQRGLEYNLRVVGLTQAVGQARGMEQIARSALMPNVTADFSANQQRTNLSAVGLNIDVPGFSLDDVAKFNVVDLHTRLSQTVVNLNRLNTYRASRESVRASELSVEDSRDLIVQSVGSAYLEAVAARARLQATQAQVTTATAIHDKTVQQRDAGLATPIDVNRAQVETLTARQRLSALQADLAKRKINLAKLVGLPPTDQYELGEEIPFSAAPAQAVEVAIKLATERRSDLMAADAQVLAAERTLAAAQAERMPTVAVNAEVGGNRASAKPAHATYSVVGFVRVPIWEGGRVAGSVAQATAALNQRRAERDDLRDQIEGDVRKAFLDLQAAASQVDVAQATLQVTRENLGLTRQRFDAGLNDNVSVVQSQQSLAAAEFDYINSVFSHNLAKLGLARSVGHASEDLARYLQLP